MGMQAAPMGLALRVAAGAEDGIAIAAASSATSSAGPGLNADRELNADAVIGCISVLEGPWLC